MLRFIISHTDETYMALMYNDGYAERSVVKAISMRTPQQLFGMTKEQAEHLRDQLTYELDRWEEE